VAITENDITLAAATNATIIGFNVRPDRKARDLAEAEHVEIRTYEIIYKLLEDIERAMVGLLAPEYEEVVTGEAEVREVFKVPKIGSIAGCYVRSGQISPNRSSSPQQLVKRFGDFTAVEGHRRRGAAGRGVRLPRPQRRGQEQHDADDRLRVAGHRARCACSARPGHATARRSAPASVWCRSSTRSTPS
jgi:hypothetical protein